MRILIKAAVFQHTAARRRLDASALLAKLNILFQHTAARRRLERYSQSFDQFSCVSTHSRPKAAGSEIHFFNHTIYSFNTQPPEGGWWVVAGVPIRVGSVSTHSRPKAAGHVMFFISTL